jgi:hypothetical protein
VESRDSRETKTLAVTSASLVQRDPVKVRIENDAVASLSQHGDGTPTGPMSASFSIRGILGLGAKSRFMRLWRRVAERFSAVASLVWHPIGGWRFRVGCSIA